MDHMTPLDAAFLHAEDEDPGVSLAISSIAVFAGPAPSYEEFATLLAGRLPLIPRYRQVVRQVPLDLGPPVWVDDATFDLSYHLRGTALPGPGGAEELSALMGRIMSARLDRKRPLWEYWMVEGLEGDRWALISKVHHCMVDGVSGTDLYGLVLDATLEPRAVAPDHWRPVPAPSSLALTAAALRDLAGTPLVQTRAMARALTDPRALAGRVRDVVRGLRALSAALVPARATSLTGPLSAHRRFVWTEWAVADVKAIRAVLGGTFNDVILSAVTGGFRELLLARGEEPGAHDVRTLVPVSIRGAGEEHTQGNRVSLMLPDLPVHVTDAVQRLAAVRAGLDGLKRSGEAEAVAALTDLAALEPFPLVAPQSRISSHLPQRSLITVATNVPGPRVQLYALGRPLEKIIPYVPIASTVRIGVSIFTYRGRITFGITGDYDTAPDLGVLATGIRAELAQLLDAAVGTEAADAAPKPAAPKQAAPKQAAPKQAAPKQAAPKQAAPKAERAPRRRAAPRPAASRTAMPLTATPRPSSPR